ncbi:MAG: hypothetical protein P1P64_00900 [Treponemataceae bacterium]
MKKKFILLFCVFASFTAYAQVSFVPHFDIFSLTKFKKEKPYFENSLDASFGFNVQAFPEAYFELNSNLSLNNIIPFFHLDKSKRKPIEAFYLNSALTFPSIKNKNIYLAFFYGQYDYLNSDRILRETAKVKMESPSFQKDFPTSVFRPDLKVDGLGFALYGCLNYMPVYFAGYGYWNGGYTKETFEISSDFRMGYSFYAGAFNTFFGAKFSQDIKKTELRAGISASFKTAETNEFYFDIGIDKLVFPEPTPYKKLYMLFEPRGIYDKFSFSIPFFMAPVSSLPKFMDQTKYADTSFMGIGLKLAGGNLEKYNFEAGTSFCTSINPENVSELTAFTFTASPFFTYAFSKYVIDCRLNIYPLLYKNPNELVNLSIQIKAVK